MGLIKIIEDKDIQDKFIIFAEGKPDQIVMKIDDEKIFKGRYGSFLGNHTFHTEETAKRGIKYLDTCHFVCKFEMMKVSEFRIKHPKAYLNLSMDIEFHNESAQINNDTYLEVCREEDQMREMTLETNKEAAIKLIKNAVDIEIQVGYNEIFISVPADTIQEQSIETKEGDK
jgi:hypothetical protein